MQGSVRANSTAILKACARPIRRPDRHGPKARAPSSSTASRRPAAAPNRGRVAARDRGLPAHPDDRSFSCQGNRR